MRITVFGATGGIGRLVVAQALSAGHEVVAVVRDAAGAGFAAHDRLSVEVADVMDPAAIEPSLKRADAVVSALGSRGGLSEPTTVCERGTASITAAMRDAGVRRIIVVSAATVTTEGDGPFTRFMVKPIVTRVLRHHRADSLRMERGLASGDRDWTVLRPPMLTDKPASGRYRTRIGANVRGGFSISRADAADAILACVEDDARIGTAVGVAD